MWAEFFGEKEITPDFIAKELHQAGGAEVQFNINSFGGDVVGGNAIENKIKKYKGKTSAYIDGACFSATTVIACACDTVYMPKNALFLVHRSWGMVVRNANGLDKSAEDMRKFDETLIATYMYKTDLSRDEIIALMDEERFLTAGEAYNYGFVDQIVDEIKDIETAIESVRPKDDDEAKEAEKSEENGENSDDGEGENSDENDDNEENQKDDPEKTNAKRVLKITATMRKKSYSHKICAAVSNKYYKDILIQLKNIENNSI